LIEDPANERLVSIASLWEMAIKASIGRLTFAQPFATLMLDQLQRNSMQMLDITVAYTAWQPYPSITAIHLIGC